MDTTEVEENGIYHDLTRECPICNLKIKAHTRCDSCGILGGQEHLEIGTTSYRGHKLCGHCRTAWKHLERQIGREATWSEFLSPKLKMFDGQSNDYGILEDLIEVMEGKK